MGGFYIIFEFLAKIVIIIVIAKILRHFFKFMDYLYWAAVFIIPILTWFESGTFNAVLTFFVFLIIVQYVTSDNSSSNSSSECSGSNSSGNINANTHENDPNQGWIPENVFDDSIFNTKSKNLLRDHYLQSARDNKIMSDSYKSDYNSKKAEVERYRNYASDAKINGDNTEYEKYMSMADYAENESKVLYEKYVEYEGQYEKDRENARMADLD